MSETDPGAQVPEPAAHVPLDADDIAPHPASARSVRFFVILVSAILVVFSVAVVIVAFTTTDTSNGLRHLINQQNTKSGVRDKQHTDTENQIKKQQQQIATLAKQLADTQTRDNAAICTLVIGLIQQGKTQNPGQPVDTTIIGPFLSRYNCKVPPGLLG